MVQICVNSQRVNDTLVPLLCIFFLISSLVHSSSRRRVHMGLVHVTCLTNELVFHANSRPFFNKLSNVEMVNQTTGAVASIVRF